MVCVCVCVRACAHALRMLLCMWLCVCVCVSAGMRLPVTPPSCLLTVPTSFLPPSSSEYGRGYLRTLHFDEGI
jgi:hypothetical protein